VNIAEYSISHKAITWMIIVICVVGGTFCYTQLGRLEDPEFTIKEAMVYTPYPGASPQEVEQEVTEKLETAIQQLPQLKRVTSKSKTGMSEITVVIKDRFDKQTLPQVWDELRRKINDEQVNLPPGAGPSIVNDDYGDVFGIYFALTGAGYSYKDLKDFADDVKRELLLVPGVAKITISNVRKESIFVDISRSRMAQLGISPNMIYQTLKSQNLVTPSGHVKVGSQYIRIHPTGALDTVKAIGNLVIRSPGSKKLIHLDDVATITRGYEEVPTSLMRYNGQPALGIGISAAPRTNVVKMGEAIEKRLHEISRVIPVGVELHPIYLQNQEVAKSIKGFIVSLGQALGIVVVVLLLFMGLRSGILIASILLLSVLGTFIFMYFFHIELQRISLGALIISLGMLVDNAIVVTEGILVKIEQGVDKLTAASEVVAQTMWPLFGATVVGILAFAGIGLSQDSTGEYTRSLFYVIFISLMLSWFLAVTAAPMFCVSFLKSGPKGGEKKDLYGGFFYRSYRGFLQFCMRQRSLTILVLVIMLGASVYGFGYVKQSFFPDATTPVFYVDYWRAQGTDIRETSADMKIIEKHIQSIKGVKSVTSLIGAGAQRFMLVYSPEQPNSSYGQFIVQVNDFALIKPISEQVEQYLQDKFPNSEPKIKFVRLGPGKDAKIEARFSGPNGTVLRQLSNKAQDIMRQSGNAVAIRDDWRQRVKKVRPLYSEVQARITGVTRANLNDTLEMAFSGKQVGLYREEDRLIPIVYRPPDNERLDIASIKDLQIWSGGLQKTVPIGQVVGGFQTTWEDTMRRRRNRKPTITASTDPDLGEASVLLNVIRPQIESMDMPPGYKVEWGGEYEDSSDAQAALATILPFSFLTMFIIVVLLFSAIRQPIIIWLCVPFSIVGVTVGLLLTNQPFGFMALLGFLSLTGMLIKNAIVLVDQIDLEIKQGKPVYEAIIDSSIGRMRPVSLAAITTVLGMIPLLFDVFFVSMSVVIMFGLMFATVLTLIVVPVFYAIFFKAKQDNHGKAQPANSR